MLLISPARQSTRFHDSLINGGRAADDRHVLSAAVLNGSTNVNRNTGSLLLGRSLPFNDDSGHLELIAFERCLDGAFGIGKCPTRDRHPSDFREYNVTARAHLVLPVESLIFEDVHLENVAGLNDGHARFGTSYARLWRRRVVWRLRTSS